MTCESGVLPEATPAAPPTVRVLAIADTDSYLKWSAATLDALPRSWQSAQLLIENPVMPSAAQIQAASKRKVEVLSHAAVIRRIRRERPDLILLACTGPVVTTLTAQRVFWGRARPVLVTGLPGISVPATRRAVIARAACDLFLLHSKREVAEFAEIGARYAPRLRFGLAALPFLPPRTLNGTAAAQLGNQLVFAAQAKVPVARADREHIVLALADAGSSVIKLRAWSEEQQTHRETWSYPEIMEDLVARRRLSVGTVGFIGGSMHEALHTARGFATISSTAALEAMAMDRPTLIISDFGVSAEMINLVFEGSGCLGTLDDLRHGRLCHPAPEWLEANYFHRAEDNDWLARLRELLAARAAGQLPGRPRSTASLRGRIRRRLRLTIPAGIWRRFRPLHALLLNRPRRSWQSLSQSPAEVDARRPGHRAHGPLHDHPTEPALTVLPGAPPDANQQRQSASRPVPSDQDH
jgi:hypothetical protein